MLAEDGFAYVVKFQNNPQNLRVLANEMLATKLAAALGLPVPTCDVVVVSEWLIDTTRELSLELPSGNERCRPGLQFGSRFVGGLMPGQTFDYLPEQQLSEVNNIREFAGMLVLDKWTCNSNGRQAVFHKQSRERRYRATFIDQGYCFYAGNWSLSDAPLQGVYARSQVYGQITGWESFEPWISRMENFAPETAWEIAEDIPPEWYGGSISELEELVERMLKRRPLVRDLIDSFRLSSRGPFPNWMVGGGALRKGLSAAPTRTNNIG
jgi:hypothetical protein